MNRNFRLTFSLSLLLLAASGCGVSSTSSSAQSNPSQTPSAQTQVSSSPTPEFPEPISFEEIEGVFVEGGGLEGARMSFNGYELTTRERTVHIRDEGHGFDVEQSDVIIMRSGRIVRRFEGMMYPLGVATRFGLYSFLGGEAKQIVIEQAINRDEYYRILDVAGDAPRVIYEGGGYISVVDLDGDGTLEIVAPINTLSFFHNLNNTNSPVSTAVFRYDERARRYNLANRRFSRFIMRDMERNLRVVEEKRPTGDELRELALPDGETNFDIRQPDYVGAVLSVLTDYVYAGREAEGWTFFDREFHNLRNKEAFRAGIREHFARDPIYIELYGR